MAFKAESFRGAFPWIGIFRVTETPGSISANSSVSVTETIPGLLDTDFVLAEIESASGVQTDVWIAARASGADTLRVIYRNEGVGSEDPGTVVVKVLVLRVDEDWLTAI